MSVQMAAEGIRKLGILQLLLENKQLNPSVPCTLFWDEPETNMNPKLVKLLVEVLLGLTTPASRAVDPVTFSAEDETTIGGATCVVKLASEPFVVPCSSEADALK